MTIGFLGSLRSDRSRCYDEKHVTVSLFNGNRYNGCYNVLVSNSGNRYNRCYNVCDNFFLRFSAYKSYFFCITSSNFERVDGRRSLGARNVISSIRFRRTAAPIFRLAPLQSHRRHFLESFMVVENPLDGHRVRNIQANLCF